MNWPVKGSFYSLLVLSAAALVGVGCDFSPLSPFAGFDGEASRVGTISGQGATLTGSFLGSGSSAASTLRASALAVDENDLTVIVLDSKRNQIGSVEVNNRTFTLRGLPESFTLVFMDGDKEIGQMTFEGVKVNQEVDIVVDVVDGEVILLEERRTGIDHEGGTGIEINGAAQNIQVDGDPMTGSLDVNGYHVVTRATGTSIRKGNRSLTLKDLSDGDQVHVRGVFEDAADGSTQVFAHEIKLQEEEEEEEDGLEGSKVTICHVPPGNPDNKKTKNVPPDAVDAHLGHGDYLGPC